MPTCPRCAPLAAVLAVLFFGLAGCDSNSTGDLSRLDGTYAIAELTFDPVTSALPDADVAAALDPSVTSLDIYGDGDDALLQTRRLGETSRSRTNLRVQASGGRISFEAAAPSDEANLRALLLPTAFSLSYDRDTPRSLEGTLTLDGVNLEAFDPSRYEDQISVRGTLRVRLERK